MLSMTTLREHDAIAPHLRTITDQRQALDAQQFELVLQARMNHMTWAQIGAALGLTPQAVQQRYAPSARG